jgi:predicted nucleic acid-binding protein
MSRVYWDSMLFVYVLEGNPTFAPQVKNILEHMARRGDVLCTSVFALGEVWTGPRKFGNPDDVARTRQFFLNSGRVELLPFSAETADRFSMIRASTSVRSADAIHLAAASEFGVDLFLTHDKKLQKLTIPGIHFIAGLDGKIF